MKKIVVAGALGHIGSRFVRRLPQVYKDCQIVLVDNLLTQRYCSLFNLPEGNYQFINADVRTVNLIPIISGAQGVFHFAAVADPGATEETIHNVNFPATLAIANACATEKVRMFFVSSTSVYGQDGKLDPKTPYAVSKLKEEGMISSLGKTKKLAWSIVRFATICGISPGMRFHTAVNKFCFQAASGNPLGVWESARSQMRPYLDLSEGVEALLFLFNHSECDSDIYNVVTENLSMEKIISLISTYRPGIKIDYIKDKVVNPASFSISDEKIRGKGFTYRGDIGICIKETLDLLKFL